MICVGKAPDIRNTHVMIRTMERVYEKCALYCVNSVVSIHNVPRSAKKVLVIAIAKEGWTCMARLILLLV